MRTAIAAVAAVFLFSVPAVAQEAGDVAAPPAEGFLRMSSAQEKDFSAVLDDVAAAEPAALSLDESDIVSWEEGADGRYLYFRLGAEARAALAQIVSEKAGAPLRVNIGDNFILIPEVSAAMAQQQGLVLFLEEGKGTEIAHSMLDRDKQAAPDTMIDEGAVPPVPPPVPAVLPSGPADGAVKGALEPGQ